MKKSLRRITAALLCLLVCVSMAGCGAGSEETEKAVDTLRYADVNYSTLDQKVQSGTVCQNDAWELIWDMQNKRVSFKEKATGNIWCPTPSEALEPELNALGLPKKNHAQIESALQVFYHNPTNMAEEIALSYTDAIQDGALYTMPIENGLRVIYDFYAFEIMVPVDYKLDGDHFTVSVNPAEIADNGVSYATGVALAPYMCGMKNGLADSWMFMPDGSGTIIKPTGTATVGDSGSIRVYGDDLTIQSYYFTSVTEQAYMPVFGCKKGDSGLCAIIDSGVEMASVAWNVDSVNIGYSGVYATFGFRGYSQISPPRGYSSPAQYIKVFTDYINDEKVQVSYYPLSGDKADITGMAEVYRNYLIKNGGLKVSEAPEKKMAVKYIGGVMQGDFFLGLPTTKLFPLTTTEDAATMTTELAQSLGNDFYVDLVGFGASGADVGKYAGNFSVGKTLGGKKGMNTLASKLEELGLPYYMDFNLIAFGKGAGGFSKGDDGVVWMNKQTAYFRGFNRIKHDVTSARKYILKRDQLVNAGNLLVKKASALGIKGISLDALSNTIYSDYTTLSTQVCKGMIKDAQTVFDNVGKEYGVLADAANDYAAVKAERVIDAPLYSSQYDFADEDVPFYELVLRGYVPMNSVSVNLCGDENDALLRCVAAGIAPTYTLTYRYDNELVTSDHNFIFGSGYAGNKARLLKAADALKAYLGSIEGAKIKEYQSLGNGVCITKFDNGVYAAVNYGEKDATTDYGVVKAGAWITGRDAQ